MQTDLSNQAGPHMMVEDAVAQISSVYPELHIHSARPVAVSGQFSRVLIVNEELIFRFPRSPYVAEAMIREAHVLRALKSQLSLPIPDPIFLHTDPDAKTVIFMGYPLLPGEPMSRNLLVQQPAEVVQAIAEQLADFLRGLHSLPPTSLPEDLPVEGTRAEWLQFYEALQHTLYPYMRPDAREQMSANFETALSDLDLWKFTPTLCHGDFGTANLLYNPKTMRITGVIDFGACGWGDPAQDIGAVWSLGANLIAPLLDQYPAMRAVLPRVQFIRSTYALQQAFYALRDGNEEEFEDGLRDYRALQPP